MSTQNRTIQPTEHVMSHLSGAVSLDAEGIFMEYKFLYKEIPPTTLDQKSYQDNSSQILGCPLQSRDPLHGHLRVQKASVWEDLLDTVASKTKK